jgi:hypothetical protein
MWNPRLDLDLCRSRRAQGSRRWAGEAVTGREVRMKGKVLPVSNNAFMDMVPRENANNISLLVC